MVLVLLLLLGGDVVIVGVAAVVVGSLHIFWGTLVVAALVRILNISPESDVGAFWSH